MKVFIVEDDKFKLSQLELFVRDILPHSTITSASSVHSGKTALRESRFDVVLLDMSLPSYDIGTDESGGRPHAFGGRELLGYMDFLDLSTPVVVVTQFDRLGSGRDEVDIKTLGKSLQEAYPNVFRQIVYFNSASEQWRVELKAAIAAIHGEGEQ